MPAALDRALDFLVAAQAPSGRLPIGMALEIDAVADDDPSLFATAMVAEAIGRHDDPRAQLVLRRAAEHLAAHVETPGVWRHWTAEHPQFAALPADADDTAWSTSVLRLAGLPVPPSASVLLENRDRRGRFRTWLLVRVEQGLPSRGQLAIGLRRLRRPVHAVLFWRATSADPRDVDGVVNAHVLAVLGPGPHARPVADYLEAILRAGAEDRCDKWYRSAFMFYAAVARARTSGVVELAAAAELVRERVQAAAGADGRLGDGPLDTALGIRALTELGVPADDPVVRQAAGYLAATQAEDGGWAAEPAYYGGPRHHPEVPCWGSRALTSGLAAAALARVPAPAAAQNR